MSSAQYAENAFGRFQYDEMMYTKYVASARHFAQQEYDPDGDNH